MQTICSDVYPQVRAVSNPGGLARQYRVQIREARHNCWRMYATFRCADSADACRSALERAGLDARIVRYNISPAGF
jgi:hypothetical protein